MNTMRERFQDDVSDIFYEIPKTGKECSNNKQKVLEFIEQELKKEREEIVEMIERNKENNPLGERAINRNEALDNIINTIKNRV